MSNAIYKGTLLPENPTEDDLRSIASDYETMLLTVMSAIADRYDRTPNYPFIDTKLNLITGEDFPTNDSIRGRNAVYGWIQGRGLEALAGHCRWMRRHNLSTDLRLRLEHMMQETLNSLRKIRSKNSGHLHFFMTPEGTPFTLNESGVPKPVSLTDPPYGFSDLFSSKGMYAAAHYLQDAQAIAEALDYCLQVDRAIHQSTFVTDQISLDPKNPVQVTPGRKMHGPYMIQIGAAALLTEAGETEGINMGLQLLRYELQNHINLQGRIQYLQEYDFWEAVNDRGQPYEDGNNILCDPGHALECIGLILKFTSIARQQNLSPEIQKEIEAAETFMPHILAHNFKNGFQPGPGGICKAYDLRSRRPINTDMPWWSLPETMRAATFCWKIAQTKEDRATSLSILRNCHNAFIQHFVRPDLHLMAYQTRNEKGKVVPVIPATADADPGYHTGLSIIDMLESFPQ